jgi:Ca2+-binding EF-hand superfamily protein
MFLKSRVSFASLYIYIYSGIGMGKFLMGSALSWFVGGKFHSGRTAKKLKAKHLKEQKQLYTQYYNDVYKLSEQNQELLSYVEQLQDTLKQTEAKHELEAIQRDYDEFKQPDIDGDDRISRAEFNMYVKNYLSNYPGLSEADYPKFEDFDHDGDGYVSFQEYAQQMALQAQQAELEQMYGSKQNQGLQDLYKETAKQAGNKAGAMYR